MPPNLGWPPRHLPHWALVPRQVRLVRHLLTVREYVGLTLPVLVEVRRRRQRARYADRRQTHRARNIVYATKQSAAEQVHAACSMRRYEEHVLAHRAPIDVMCFQVSAGLPGACRQRQGQPRTDTCLYSLLRVAAMPRLYKGPRRKRGGGGGGALHSSTAARGSAGIYTSTRGTCST